MKRRQGSRFRGLFRLQNQVSVNDIKINNVRLEYKKTPADNLRNGNNEHKDLANEKTLSVVFSENVGYLIEEVQLILDPLKSYVRNYFLNENVRVNLLLQKSILVLTGAILVKSGK
jgi:hypothetical protein